MIQATSKPCTKCGEIKPLEAFGRRRGGRDGLNSRCKECNSAAASRWAAANPQRAKAWRARLRAAVFARYGTSCACCGTTENLSIDHINGGGREHREELGLRGAGWVFYRWLAANDFPEGFGTLCRRCNTSKGETGHCRLQHRA
jgi:hypothetical protein